MEDLLPIPAEFKLYKDRAISVGTFLGGPLTGGYLMAENFKRLGENERAKATWIISIVATIVIFGGLFIIPGIEKVPNYIIPIVYTSVAGYLAKRFQGASIREHIETGGEVYSIWRVLFISLIGVAIMVMSLFAIVLLINK